MKVICLSGWKQSGKDTLAAYLIDKFNAVRTSFADPLKDFVAEQYGIARSSLDDPDRKEAPLLDMPVDPQDAYSRMIAEFLIKEFRTADGKQMDSFIHCADGFLGMASGGNAGEVYWTPRALAILEGSTKRSVSSSYWVQKALQSIKDCANMLGSEIHVISDLRYKSEMQQLKEAFGSDVIFVRINRFDQSPSKDPSERDLDGEAFDHYVDNRGSKEEAFRQIDMILAHLGIGNETLPRLGF